MSAGLFARMSKRRLLLLIIILAGIIFIWQLPNLLKAIPSRYVAAYVPEPIQAIAVRDHVEVLPTAASVTTVDLAAGQAIFEQSPPSAIAAPPTPTAIATSTAYASSSDNLGQQSSDDDLTPTPSQTPPPTATSYPISQSARLEPLRHHFQTWNNCGPATLAMALSYFDIFLNQEETAAFLKPNPEDRNVSPWEMAAFVNERTDLRSLERSNGDLETLRRLIAAGIPVIVELGLDPPGEYRWMGWYGHYLLVVAYDDAEGLVWVYDSWFGTSEVPGENASPDGRQVSYADLDKYWQQFNRNYIVLYKPEQTSDLEAIIGSDMDDNNMWTGALARAKAEAASQPDNPFAWFNLGTNYTALGDYENAATAFDRARSLELPWRMLWYQFGPFEAYSQIERYDDVILLADVTLQDRPYFEESYYYKGLALASLGQIKEARDNLEKAIRFNPNFKLAEQLLQELEARATTEIS